MKIHAGDVLRCALQRGPASALGDQINILFNLLQEAELTFEQLWWFSSSPHWYHVHLNKFLHLSEEEIGRLLRQLLASRGEFALQGREPLQPISLCLRGCSQVTGTLLDVLIRGNCTLISRVDISHCPRLSCDTARASLGTIQQEALSHLSLRGCVWMKEEDYTPLFPLGLAALEHLDLSCSPPHLSDSGLLQALKETAGGKVNVEGCPRLTSKVQQRASDL